MPFIFLGEEDKLRMAVVLDIDLHFGDGTANIFQRVPQVTYFHPEANDREQFVHSISQFLSQHEAEMIATSAGFDRHEADWGKMLTTEDYGIIGKLVKEFAEGVCQGKRYGVLEGGYNHQLLGKNVKCLLDGMT